MKDGANSPNQRPSGIGMNSQGANGMNSQGGISSNPQMQHMQQMQQQMMMANGEQLPSGMIAPDGTTF